MTSKAKPTNMRVLQILLLLIIAVRVNSDGIPFDFCSDNDDCPLNATCVKVNDESRCVCDGKLYPFIPPIKDPEVVMFLCTRRYMFLCMH